MRSILMAYRKEVIPGDELPRWLRSLGAYLLHVVIACVGIPLVSIFFGAALEKLGISRSAVDLLFLWGPVFPAQALLGFLGGLSVSKFLRSRSAEWAWLPAIALAIWGIYSYEPLGAAYGARYLFGTKCVGCADQLLVVIPLVASIAYSLGAWLLLKRKRAT